MNPYVEILIILSCATILFVLSYQISKKVQFTTLIRACVSALTAGYFLHALTIGENGIGRIGLFFIFTAAMVYQVFKLKRL
ncbi:MAG: hypothetical protein MUC81_03960 [Bacteroidia bacterium]|jgi:hypothetical protein|nr:hypothetical protein [Bacteroidia bacterium]